MYSAHVAHVAIIVKYIGGHQNEHPLRAYFTATMKGYSQGIVLLMISDQVNVSILTLWLLNNDSNIQYQHCYWCPDSQGYNSYIVATIFWKVFILTFNNLLVVSGNHMITSW